jgi:hypothetical protein
MRKIASKYEEERKGRRSRIVLSVFLLLIMFISVIAYGFESFLFSGSGSQDSANLEIFDHNGLKFVKQGGFWTLNEKGNDFIFRHNPGETREIDSPLNGIESYRGKVLYVYSEDFNQESEIRTNMAPFVLRMQKACHESTECNGDFPVKTCEDNFIIILEGKEDIKQENNCVFIWGKKEDLTMLTDSFLFRILGIND